LSKTRSTKELLELRPKPLLLNLLVIPLASPHLINTRPTLTEDMMKFSTTLRKDLKDVPHDKIVSVDVCKFSIFNLVLPSYAPTGGGQPSTIQTTYDHIDFMYTALVADGSQLPPVIFTSDCNVPENVEGRQDAFVVSIPDLSRTPSAEITSKWLDRIEDWLDDETHLLHDAGGEFSSKRAQDDIHMYHVKTHKIPSAGGVFFNPNDNNFHHDMKCHYYQRQHTTHAEMLRHMIDSYFAVPEKNIINYFKGTRVIGLPFTRRHVTKQISEGYRPGKAHKEVYRKCVDAYAAWKKKSSFSYWFSETFR